MKILRAFLIWLFSIVLFYGLIRLTIYITGGYQPVSDQWFRLGTDGEDAGIFFYAFGFVCLNFLLAAILIFRRWVFPLKGMRSILSGIGGIALAFPFLFFLWTFFVILPLGSTSSLWGG